MSDFFALDRRAMKDLAGRCSPRLRGPCLSLMRYLLTEANYQDAWVGGKLLQRGQVFCSLTTMEESTGLSKKTLRNALEQLSDGHYDTVKRGTPGARQGARELALQGARDGYTVTCLSYDTYDGSKNGKGTPTGTLTGILDITEEARRGHADPDRSNVCARQEVKEANNSLSPTPFSPKPAQEQPDTHKVREIPPPLANPSVPEGAEEPEFVPDPNYSPNAMLKRWDDGGLPMLRSKHWSEQENAFRRLHFDHPHWSKADIERAIDKLIADHRGPKQLHWAWKEGPVYLVRSSPDSGQGIEKVLNWETHPRAGPGNTSAPIPRKSFAEENARKDAELTRKLEVLNAERAAAE